MNKKVCIGIGIYHTLLALVCCMFLFYTPTSLVSIGWLVLTIGFSAKAAIFFTHVNDYDQ